MDLTVYECVQCGADPSKDPDLLNLNVFPRGACWALVEVIALSVPFWFDNVAPAPVTFRIYVFNEAYLMHVYVHEGVSMSYYLQRRFICEAPCTRHIPSVGKCRIKCLCVSVGGKSLLVKIATGCPAIMSSV